MADLGPLAQELATALVGVLPFACLLALVPALQPFEGLHAMVIDELAKHHGASLACCLKTHALLFLHRARQNDARVLGHTRNDPQCFCARHRWRVVLMENQRLTACVLILEEYPRSAATVIGDALRSQPHDQVVDRAASVCTHHDDV